MIKLFDVPKLPKLKKACQPQLSHRTAGSRYHKTIIKERTGTEIENPAPAEGGK